MIKSLARLMLRGLRRLADDSNGNSSVIAGFVDFRQFEGKIAKYRSFGAKIGKKVRLLGDLDGVNPHLISIGDYSVIGKNSIILAHCPINGARTASVGRYVYVGYGVIVLPGVEIGDNCLIGAGAVVTKSVPPNSVLAGNPARIIRTLRDDERVQIERTLNEGKIFGWGAGRPSDGTS